MKTYEGADRVAWQTEDQAPPAIMFVHTEPKRLARLELHQLVNLKSQAFRKMGLSLAGLGEEEIIRLIGENPRILIRPLLTDGQKVLQGFNEKDYEEFTGQ